MKCSGHRLLRLDVSTRKARMLLTKPLLRCCLMLLLHECIGIIPWHRNIDLWLQLMCGLWLRKSRKALSG